MRYSIYQNFQMVEILTLKTFFQLEMELPQPQVGGVVNVELEDNERLTIVVKKFYVNYH